MTVKNIKYPPPPTTINAIKDNKLKQKLINILNHIDGIENNKIKDFEESVGKFKNDKSYKLIDPLLRRQFLFKAVKEVNEKVIKNNEELLLDFTDKAYDKFITQTLFYFKDYYDYENETVDLDAIGIDTYHLDSLIKKHTNDKKIIGEFKKLNTNLPTLYEKVKCNYETARIQYFSFINFLFLSGN